MNISKVTNEILILDIYGKRYTLDNTKQIKKGDYLNITVDKNSNIYIQETIIKKRELINKIKAILSEKPQIQIMIYGDQSTHYGDIIYVFSTIREASIYNVTLVTEE